MGRSTAAVQIVLRADGRLRVVTTRYKGAEMQQESGFVKGWADVEVALNVVRPVEARKVGGVVINRWVSLSKVQSLHQTPLDTQRPSDPIPQHPDQESSGVRLARAADWPTAEEIGEQLSAILPASATAREERIYRLRRGTPPERFLAALLSWWRPV